MLNTLERFHIYKETMNQNQINDHHTIMRNAIFDAVPHNPTSTTWSNQFLTSWTWDNTYSPRNSQSTPVYHHPRQSARLTPSRKELKKNRRLKSSSIQPLLSSKIKISPHPGYQSWTTCYLQNNTQDTIFWCTIMQRLRKKPNIVWIMQDHTVNNVEYR
jgi:hypothetical protein